jgi:hypothetical protein
MSIATLPLYTAIFTSTRKELAGCFLEENETGSVQLLLLSMSYGYPVGMAPMHVCRRVTASLRIRLPAARGRGARLAWRKREF